MHTPLLSICIPSYNRADKTYALVSDILSVNLPEDRFEVVVADNCSTDRTCDRLETLLGDNRFRLIRHPENIGGISNLTSVLDCARGEYALLCLDKDRLATDRIPDLIERLRTLPGDIAFGQLPHNTETEGPDQVWDQGYPTLLAMGYDCAHPSGMWVRTELLRQSGLIDQLKEHSRHFPFNIDLIKAHMAMLGRGCRIDLPLVQTETLQEAGHAKSHTYSGNNIWFLPHNLVNYAVEFMRDCATLGLDEHSIDALTGRIYAQNLYKATTGFRTLMASPALCAHHSIACRKVTVWEMACIHVMFARTFWNSAIPLAKGVRGRVILITGAKWLYNIVFRR